MSDSLHFKTQMQDNSVKSNINVFLWGQNRIANVHIYIS